MLPLFRIESPKEGQSKSACAKMAETTAVAGISLSDLNLDYNAIWVLLVTVAAFLVPIVLVFPPFPPQKSDALLQTHSKAGVGRGESNLQDQSSLAAAAATGASPRIQSLVIYPVKSCRGIEVSQSRVLPSGLEFDRIYTFAQLRGRFPAPVDVDADADADADKKGEKSQDAWEFITQRQFPRLATVKVDLWVPDEAKMRRQGLDPIADAFLILRFPWRDLGWRGALQTLAAKLAERSWAAEAEREVMLPVGFPSGDEVREKGYEYEDVRIWKDTVSALNVEGELPAELRLYLGVSHRLGLFRVDPARLREVYRCAPRKAEAGYQPVTGFQDAVSLIY